MATILRSLGGGSSGGSGGTSGPPVTITYAASITPDASLGNVQRCTATGDLTVADILNGVDGQELILEVLASGGTRALTFAGATETIPAGVWWIGAFRYHSSSTTWVLGSGGGGTDPEIVRDTIAGALVAGSNVTITPSDVGDTITIAAATSGSSGIPASTVDAKGDLIAGTANDTVARLAVGADGLALVANSVNATGLGWTAPTPASHTHAAADLASGTVATARLGAGTASSTTFLRGDQTWADPGLVGINTQTTSYTLTLSDSGKIVTVNSGSAQTVTIPPNSSVAFPVGTPINGIARLGAGGLTIAAGAGVTLTAAAGLTLRTQGSVAAAVKIATDTWLVWGDLLP